MSFEKESFSKHYFNRFMATKFSSYALIGGFALVAIVFTAIYTQPDPNKVTYTPAEPVYTTKMVITTPEGYKSPTQAVQSATDAATTQPATTTGANAAQAVTPTATNDPANVPPTPGPSKQIQYADPVFTTIDFDSQQ